MQFEAKFVGLSAQGFLAFKLFLKWAYFSLSRRVVNKASYENVLNEGSSLELSLTYSSLDLGELFGKSTGLGGQGK